MAVTDSVDISVVVVNWNRRELLRACLDSLAAQEAAAFEVIVVDNGSSDGSPALVEEFARAAPFPVNLIRNQVNRGFCAANNQGIAAARGAFIALLNNDAEAVPRWLAELRAAFGRGADVGMAASKVLVWEDPRIIDKAGHLIYLDGQNRGRGSGELDRGQYDAEEEALWPDGCAAMYRAAMLREIGGFDEDFFAYGDDAELGLRARRAGWTCRYMPRAVVRHHRGATLGRNSGRRLELIERNRVLLAVKLFPGRLLCLNGTYFLARLAAGLLAAARNRGEIGRFQGPGEKLRAALALLRGTLQALPLLPRMWARRRRLRPLWRLTPAQTEALLRRYRIPLRDLSEQAVGTRS